MKVSMNFGVIHIYIYNQLQKKKLTFKTNRKMFLFITNMKL
jgi:hypothetical protein